MCNGLTQPKDSRLEGIMTALYESMCDDDYFGITHHQNEAGGCKTKEEALHSFVEYLEQQLLPAFKAWDELQPDSKKERTRS